MFLENGGNTGLIVGLIIGAVVLLIIVLYCVTRIKIVRQTNKYVVERLGGYHTTWGVGFHFLCPFIDKVAHVVSMKEQVKDFDPQPVITKDNVTMQIDTVVFFQVTDPKLFAYGVENPIAAIENLSATTLRNIIGELDLDETLTSRDIINTKMRSILDEATDPWGIKVNRVEVKNILPPKDIRDAMERQMRAERERREKILLAEGEKKSQILLAEGQKESQVLKAAAEKEAMILKSEGQAQSILKVKEAEAEGIKLIRQAEAEGLKSLNAAKVTNEVLTLKSYEAVRDLANGQATKIIVPSELQNLATAAQTISEVIKK
ncbi:MAG: SPFH/Band 7/PHB domain protein [Acholeplasmatales bacterium]|nr:SPFH/Band 7/PHB domain protein [Acholeplasmatales bacterium]